MAITVYTSNRGCFACCEASCITLSPWGTAYGSGATLEEALANLRENFAEQVRDCFACIGHQAYIWYPGELPGGLVVLSHMAPC